MMELLLMAAASGRTVAAPTVTTTFAQSFTDETVVFYACAADADGNAYLAGGYDLDEDTEQYTYGIIIKCDENGAVLWGRKYSQKAFYGVDVDSSGNVYCVGERGSVVKYNSSGVLQWKKALGVSGGVATVTLKAVAEYDGNVYVVGTKTSTSQLVVAKLNSSGSTQWSRSLSSTTSGGTGIAVDSSGVYVGGNYNDGAASGVLAQYNTSGAIQWQKGLTSSGSVFNSAGVALDSSNNVLLAGYCGNPEAASLFKFNSSGTSQWQAAIAIDDDPQTGGVAVDASNNVYTCRYLQTAAALLLTKHNSSGTSQWNRTLKTGSYTAGAGAAIAGSLVIAAGSTLTVGVHASLPVDGSLTGAQTPWTYSSVSPTASGGGASVAAGALTDASISLSSGTGAGTDSVFSPIRAQKAFA